MKKRKKKDNMFKKIVKKVKGFTLVELLAVIVILAIIMIIAIPSVLGTMTTARQKTFAEFLTKSYEATENQYLTEQLQTSSMPTCVLYDITKDIGLSSTGSFNGYVLAVKKAGEIVYYLTLWDGEYMVGAINHNDIEDVELLAFTSESDPILSKDYLANTGGCATYEDKTSVTPVTPDQSVGSNKKLFTGIKNGANGWIAHYTNGEMDQCYYKKVEDYCVGNYSKINSGSAISNPNICSSYKSLECCSGDTTEDMKHLVYGWYNSTDNKCVYWLSSDNALHLNMAAGGGLPTSGVYE